MDAVRGFRGKHFFLSNFYPCKVEVDGLVFSNAEAAFQSAKTTDPELRRQFCNLSGADAKRFGRRVPLRPDWDRVKDDVMYRVIRAKFAQNSELTRALLATGDALLVEENTWNDTYWGVCGNRGQNRLGEILMRIRAELREEH